jgi:hypothetical protein
MKASVRFQGSIAAARPATLSGRSQPPRSLPLGFLTLVVLAANASAQAQYEVRWQTVDNGGGRAGNGPYDVHATVGQSDTGRLTGGGFVVEGGFWPAAIELLAPSCPGAAGDADCDGTVDFFDIDAFLEALFEPPSYATMFCGGAICTTDIDCSGAVDFFDIDGFLACVFGDCPPCP